MNRLPSHRHQLGVTLVELMIAMTLNLILLSGAFSVYISNQRIHRTSEGIAQVQENLRIASDYLNREGRMAGSGFSCSPNQVENLLKDQSSFEFNYTQVITGYDNGSELPKELQGKALSGTDVLVVRGSYGTGARLESEMNNSSAVLKTTVMNPAPFKIGDIVVITDCRSASIFQVTNYTSANGNVVHNTGQKTHPGNTSKKFQRSYSAGASVIKARTAAYYIGKGASGQPALFKFSNENGTSQSIEIVDGVHDMQLTFAEDRDNNGYPNGYYKASDIKDWNKVISVRTSLLASSLEDNLLDAPNQYEFNQQTITPEDRKIYRTTTFVTAIRGRLQ